MKKSKLRIIAAVCMVLVCAIVTGCVAAGPMGEPPVVNEELIKEDAVEQFSTLRDTCKPEEVKLTIISQFGDTYALFVDLPFLAYTQALWTDTVNGLKFNYFDGQRMYIYADREFHTFRDAFGEQIITADQLTAIWEDYYEKYPNRKDMFKDPTLSTTQPTEPEEPTQPESMVTLYLLTEITAFTMQGEEISKTKYTYDERGLLIGIQGEMGSQNRDYTYDEYGHITSETVTPMSGEQRVSTYSYTYDENGVLQSYTGVINNGYLLPLYRVQYDSQGRVEKVTAEENGVVWEAYICTYDAQGRLIKLQHQGANNAIVIWEIAYDQSDFFMQVSEKVSMDGAVLSTQIDTWSGNPEESVVFRGSNVQVRMNYADGILKEMKHQIRGSLQKYNEYTTDENGNVVHMYFQADPMYYEYTYQKIKVSREEATLWRPYLNEYSFGMDITKHLDNIINFILPHDSELMRPRIN